MKLIEMTVTDYMDVLGSDVPAPGGGSAAARPRSPRNW